MTNLPIISVKNDQIVTNSRDVADFFKKAHKNVLRDIDTLMLKIEPQGQFVETTRTGKRHDNVLVDIRKMFTDLSFQVSDFLGDYKDGTGRKLLAYHLPKRETLILVSGYSVVLRAKIIDRWQELEAQIKAPALPDFSNPALAARAWAEQ